MNGGRKSENPDDPLEADSQINAVFDTETPGTLRHRGHCIFGMSQMRVRCVGVGSVSDEAFGTNGRRASFLRKDNTTVREVMRPRMGDSWPSAAVA